MEQNKIYNTKNDNCTSGIGFGTIHFLFYKNDLDKYIVDSQIEVSAEDSTSNKCRQNTILLINGDIVHVFKWFVCRTVINYQQCIEK